MSNLQEKNRQWWSRNPMSYDWHRTLTEDEGSEAFFAEIDERFFNRSPFTKGDPPFGRLIPFGSLKGKRVLEIGCGMGSHAQLLAQAGADLTAIDLTPRAVEVTSRRLSNIGLKAEVRVMDAEHLEFPDKEFDFVWSWGVIHHSADTEQIVKEISRVTKPGGEVRLMVYNRRSLYALMSLLRGLVSGKLFKGVSVEEVLTIYSDGAIARHFSRSEFRDLLVTHGFADATTRLLGQTSELVPLPGTGPIGRFKDWVIRHLPDRLVEALLSSVGWFLFAVAKKPTSA